MYKSPYLTQLRPAPHKVIQMTTLTTKRNAGHPKNATSPRNEQTVKEILRSLTWVAEPSMNAITGATSRKKILTKNKVDTSLAPRYPRPKATKQQ